MTAVRFVTDRFAVADQLRPEDLSLLADEGVTAVVDNRPDGEEPGQPTSAEMAAAAETAGVSFAYVPITGAPGPAQSRGAHEALEETDGLVVAYCRSGTRSIMAWALGEAATGERSPEELVELAADAGYDLRNFQPMLEAAAPKHA